MRPGARTCAAAIAAPFLWLCLCLPAKGAGLKVFPVRMQISPDEPVQTLTVENSSDAPSRVQLRVYSWRQDKGEEVLEETRDVLANPGQFEIAPGERQIARFGLRTQAGGQEKSYRVILEEIPGMRATRPGEVQTLLRISIPIFVPPADAGAHAGGKDATGRLVWRVWPSGPGKIAVAIRNDGKTHVQINRLAMTVRAGREVARQDMSVYLLPGSQKRLTMALDAPVAPGDRLSFSARTDQSAGMTTADLIAEAPPSEAAVP